jgi:DNA-binding transcriptional regulator YdaS (Cro superfamily)
MHNLPPMNTLTQYLKTVESAETLAARVGCSHTTLYRIAKGKVQPRRSTAARIEAETRGQVKVAELYAIIATATEVSEPAAVVGDQEAA